MWRKHEELVIKSLDKKSDREELAELLETHREKLDSLKHERLVHLVVTMTVSLCTLVWTVASVFAQQILFLVPGSMLFLLLMGYLIHYRELENTVQRWYTLTDDIKKKMKS